MIRQALPFPAYMHIAVKHAEAAHVYAIQSKHRQSGRKTARRTPTMKMEHIMHIQLAGQRTAHLIAPIIEIAGDDERHIRRDSAPDMLDQNACLRPPAFGEQAKVDAQAMHALPIRQFNLAMQQPAVFKAMRGNINVQGLQDRKAAEYRVAMMPRLVHRVLAVGAMWPDFPRDEFVLGAVRIVVITLRRAGP